jgi:D-beta-D-heptose 7-phosphate kinase/D-beta-D-heptose 1-phosphate adenosyltransferase
MTKPKILVVGDLMTDKYYFGTTTRISPEAPIPVVAVYETKQFSGGAGNVRQNLSALGAESRLEGGWHNKGTYLVYPEKNRLMVGNTQIARWDEYDKVDPIKLERLDEAILHWTPNAIIVSDYGKGSVDQAVINWLEDFSWAHKDKPIFIDTKRSPEEFHNLGTLVTFFPNQAEYHQYQNEYDNCRSVVLKQGEKGISQKEFNNTLLSYPAWAKQVVSVCGAGDTVIAAYAFASCTGYNPLEFANAAAAVVVEKPFTATASVQEAFDIWKARSNPCTLPCL